MYCQKNWKGAPLGAALQFFGARSGSAAPFEKMERKRERRSIFLQGAGAGAPLQIQGALPTSGDGSPIGIIWDQRRNCGPTNNLGS